jgi:hypothetical protein
LNNPDRSKKSNLRHNFVSLANDLHAISIGHEWVPSSQRSMQLSPTVTILSIIIPDCLLHVHVLTQHAPRLSHLNYPSLCRVDTPEKDRPPGQLGDKRPTLAASILTRKTISIMHTSFQGDLSAPLFLVHYRPPFQYLPMFVIMYMASLLPALVWGACTASGVRDTASQCMP